MTQTTERQPLTDTQRRVYEFIADYCRQYGYGPTIRELGERYRWTPNGVACHLRQLRRKGWITWVAKQSRTLQPTGGDA